MLLSSWLFFFLQSCRDSSANCFWKGGCFRKVYGKPTNNCEQFVNAFVTDEHRYSPSLPLQEANELADQGKEEVVVSNVLSSSANDGQCMRDDKLSCSRSEIPPV